MDGRVAQVWCGVTSAYPERERLLGRGWADTLGGRVCRPCLPSAQSGIWGPATVVEIRMYGAPEIMVAIEALAAEKHLKSTA